MTDSGELPATLAYNGKTVETNWPTTAVMLESDNTSRALSYTECCDTPANQGLCLYLQSMELVHADDALFAMQCIMQIHDHQMNALSDPICTY